MTPELRERLAEQLDPEAWSLWRNHGLEKQRVDETLRDIDYIDAELTAAGYAVVPREPNEEMRIAALNTHLPEPHEPPLYEKVYQAMLKAAEDQT